MRDDVTIVLVHGASGGAWMWKPVAEELDRRHVAHVEMDLPSVGVDVDPNVDVHTDAQYLRDVVDRVGGPVVLCGNSYGGFVITEASAGHSKVRHLIYLAALMPDAGDELSTWMFSHLNPEFSTAVIPREDGLIDVDRDAMKKMVFQQSTPEVVEWALSRLRPMAFGAAGAPTVTGVGWQDIPSTYIVCSEDLALRPESQRQWARERATESVEVPFDHVASLSHPIDIADILARIAASVEGASAG
jgi:pimeloyl-ACP methyl ester carboxylesterase